MHAAHPDRNIRLLMGYWFLRDFQLWIPVWVVFLTLDRGFSLTQVTTAEGIFLIGVLLLEVPTGAVADRWGRSKSLGLGALALGLAVLVFAFTNSFSLLLVSFLMWSVASALMSGADMALLFDTLKAAGREAEYERLAGRGTAVSWAGVGLATALGGPVAALFDTRTTIFIGAATCLLTAFAAFAIWEPPHEREEAGTREAYWASIPAAFNEAWRAVDVRLLIVLAGTAFAALEAVHYLVQPYLVDRDLEVGLWFSLLQVPMLLAGLGGALAAGRIAAKFGAARVFLVGPLVGGLGYAALSLTPGLGAYAALPLIMGVSSCVEPVATGYINRRIGSERRATVLSIGSMCRSLVMAALAPGLGYATDQWGLREAFALGGAVAIASGLVFGSALMWRMRGQVVVDAAAEGAAAG
jgi:MFS family permease